MKHSAEDFPFRITDVARLMGITVRTKNAKSWDCDCIFCGRKQKLNINFIKDVYNCNYCGAHGGKLALYGDYYNLTHREAYEEICSGLHLDTGGEAINRPKAALPEPVAEIPNSDLAPEKEIHRTYSMLLSFLTLTEKHRQDLQGRGLTDAQIEQCRYRSTPVFGFKQIVGRLVDAGCTIQGVPGFYQDKDGKWTMNFTGKGSGFLVPMKAINGNIRGMQIRLDHPRDGQKYIWFSSVNKNLGVSSGSPVHFIGDPADETLYITEGGLKGSIAHYLSGHSFLCIAGVTQYNRLPAALEELKAHGLKYVKEAYDMDKLMQIGVSPENCAGCKPERRETCEAYRRYTALPEDMKENMVRMDCPAKLHKRNILQNACRHLYEICQKLGLSCHRIVWDTSGEGEWNGEVKGIDDCLYKQRRQNE